MVGPTSKKKLNRSPAGTRLQDGIGRAMKRLRDEHSVTQEELAARTGYTVRTIGRWENAKSNPKPQQIGAVVSAIVGPVTIASYGDFFRIAGEEGFPDPEEPKD